MKEIDQLAGKKRHLALRMVKFEKQGGRFLGATFLVQYIFFNKALRQNKKKCASTKILQERKCHVLGLSLLIRVIWQLLS